MSKWQITRLTPLASPAHPATRKQEALSCSIPLLRSWRGRLARTSCIVTRRSIDHCVSTRTHELTGGDLVTISSINQFM